MGTAPAQTPPSGPGVRLADELLRRVEAAFAAVGRLAEPLVDGGDARRPRRAAAVRAVLEDAGPALGAVERVLRTGAFDDRLAAVGLGGSALDMKLGAAEEAFDLWDRFRREAEDAAPSIARAGPDWARGRKLLLRFLRWVDRLLGSMIAAIPGLDALEILKEAKEFLEGAVEDAAEDAGGDAPAE